MSVSLLSRQLGSLKIAQRTAAPWLASRAMSAVAGSSSPIMCTAAPSSPSINPIRLSNTMTHQPNQLFSLQQNDFSTVPEQSILSDDGGPVVDPSTLNLKEMSNEELADMSTIPGWNLVHNPPRRNPRGALVGKVVSDKMQKTVNVAVDRYRIVPKYRKRLRFTRKFMAHDEHEVCNVGDLVMIVPCQKISRHKHFMVREIIRPKGQL